LGNEGAKFLSKAEWKFIKYFSLGINSLT